MDALLRAPMETVLARVDLIEPVRTALLDRKGSLAPFLELVEAYESGDWDRVAESAPRVGLSTIDVPQVYLDAVRWTRQLLAPAA
jgi:EAL and modified HD-GYP domain-containing signal transduction protein